MKFLCIPITSPLDLWWLNQLPIVEWPGGFFNCKKFNITVIDRPSKENLVADFLSRIQHEDGTKPIDDTFPDEHIFVVSIQTPWFADIANYLATGKLTNHLSPDENCHIIVQSSNYSWVDNDLFRTGPDLIIRRCMWEDEMTDILHACLNGPCGGHFSYKWTT